MFFGSRLTKRTLLAWVALSHIGEGARVKPRDIVRDSVQCDQKLVRFRQLENQASFYPGQDPFFLPGVKAIAEPGKKCGDSAQGISSSCDQFDRWTTFQDVSKAANLLGVYLIGSFARRVNGTRPHYSDINQGQLGNCGFLAGLAAVVAIHPEIIENMFVDRHLWSQNIFKTRWQMQGRTQTLTVDNFLPGIGSYVFFTQPSDKVDFWPVILAKTWAKAFGSFKAAEGTRAEEAIKAITRAPSEAFKLHKDFKDNVDPVDSLWHLLEDSRQKNYAISASTAGYGNNPEEYGLAHGHAYAVLDVMTRAPYGKVVKMFNPWNRNNYQGDVPRSAYAYDHSPGVFIMTISEFYRAFYEVSVNYVSPDYASVSSMMSAGSLHSAKVSVPSPGKFWVSIVWPSDRMISGVGRHCPFLTVGYTLKIESKNETGPGQLVGEELKHSDHQNDAVFEIDNPRGGVYDILAGTTLPTNASWVREVSLTVYAPGEPRLEMLQESSESLGERALRNFGPEENGKACRVAWLDVQTYDRKSGSYANVRQRVFADTSTPNENGIPKFWTADKTKFLSYYSDYAFQLYVDKWLLFSSGETDQYVEKDYSKANFTCDQRPFECEHIQGATKRKYHQWYHYARTNSCKCKDHAAVLGDDCALSEPDDRRYFSKTKMQELTDDQLARCKCAKDFGS